MTTISLDISIDYEASRPPDRPQPRGFRGLAVSLLVHGALIGLVVFFSVKQKTHDEPQHQLPLIIDATLLIPEQITQNATNVETEDESQSQLSDTEIPEQNVTEESMSEEPTIQEADDTLINEKTSESPPLEQTQAPIAREQPLTSNETSDNAQARFNSPIEFTRRYFEQSAQNIAGEEAERASREYRAQQNSPTIYDTRTGEEEQEERPEVTVNCSSVAAKAVTLLSGIGGGTLRCSDQGDPTRFIDARINKKPINSPRGTKPDRDNP
ncbi:cell envelope integrity protein TolA [Alteromonas sp. KUL49]|uniref:cell envelope integrity protein TolA n=1 Tax=Alteromonas sp. KUL49 TaxID=2480798 RepID=UPI00102F264E|nr:cell envelope integrity protein TolA [Alteromonas sp. KUL49]TAP42495.1 hypothetical protein EYS00_02440 [Alteromonas sp. KUL49]GEA10120.1 hypothetical protein KUL49_04950 [Alteromonas sp. KUL49]